jgi:ribosomal protein S18 acetylase RimI-like enzyme
MAVLVREARPDEFETLGRIVVAAYREVGALAGDEGYVAELSDVAGRASTAVVLAAVDAEDGRPIGCATYVPGLASPLAEELGPGEASIRMLAVDPAATGRGAGSALAAACVAMARRDGFHRIVLHSLPAMAGAQRIYERLGFRHAPERDWVPVPEIHLLCFVLDLDAGEVRAAP